MQTELAYTVPGMSCDSCRATIAEELSDVAGVDDVAVDLQTKRVTVRGEDVDDAAVRAAIVEAGYEVV
jgi:copper chaperone